ncbi:MAG TPA: hypothetical protein VMU15_03705 [Anaeromyxobacter sp.]|nr:hypothetical protein [Anaeromyxobacter sp.]
MRFVLAPVLVAAAALALAIRSPLPQSFWVAATSAAAIFAIAAMVAAARSFRGGDFMRWAWSLSAVPYGTATVSVVAAAVSPGAGPSALTLALSITGNVISVPGAALFVLAYRRAGFALVGRERAPALVIYAGGLALALVLGSIVIAPVVRELAVAQPPIQPALDLLSTLADAACFVLALPLLRIAFAFRGGRLSWTWTLLAVTNLFWLTADLAFGLAHGSAAATLVYRVIFLTANVAGGAAALSHRAAVAYALRAATRSPRRA